MPEDSNFEDESFDLSEIEDSVGTGPIFQFDGTRIDNDGIAMLEACMVLRCVGV